MDISRLTIQNQALAAQLYGSQAGAGGIKVGEQQYVNPQTQVGAIGTEDAGSSKFDWRNLAKFDNYLTPTNNQNGVVKTNESPTEVGGVELYGAKGVGAQYGGVQSSEQNSGLMASLNQIDARDIGLNGDRTGFEGQKRLNLLA